MTVTPTQRPAVTTHEPPPRRNWLILAVAALLLIIAAGALGWWIGSSSDVASEMPEVVEEFYDALLEGDSMAIAALFTEDGGLTGSQEEQTRSDLSSPTEIQQTLALWFSFVDYTNIENLSVISEGDKVVVVSRLEGMSATHQRRTSKTPFSATVVDVFELRDGLIAQCDLFFDYNDVVT